MNLIGTVTKMPIMIREIFISEWTLSLNTLHTLQDIFKTQCRHSQVIHWSCPYAVSVEFELPAEGLNVWLSDHSTTSWLQLAS